MEVLILGVYTLVHGLCFFKLLPIGCIGSVNGCYVRVCACSRTGTCWLFSQNFQLHSVATQSEFPFHFAWPLIEAGRPGRPQDL